jgi:hypothetical protein
MVPTFCADEQKLKYCDPAHDVLGNAKAGDGDLPLTEGDGGGEPKRESSSRRISSCSVCSVGSDSIPVLKGTVLVVIYSGGQLSMANLKCYQEGGMKGSPG